MSARPRWPRPRARASCSRRWRAAAAPDAPPEAAAPWRAVLAARTVAAERDGWLAPAAHEGVLIDDEIVRRPAPALRPGTLVERVPAQPLRRLPLCVLGAVGAGARSAGRPRRGAGRAAARQPGPQDSRNAVRPAGRGQVSRPGRSARKQIAALLDEVCDEVLPPAAERYGFRPGPLWEHEQRELRQRIADVHGVGVRAGAGRLFPAVPARAEVRPAGSGYGPVEIAGLESATHQPARRGRPDRPGRRGPPAGDRLQDGQQDVRRDGHRRRPRVAERLVRVGGGDADARERRRRRTPSTGTRALASRAAPSAASTRRRPCLVAQAAAKAVQFAGAARDGWFSAAPSRGGGGWRAARRATSWAYAG